LVHFVHFEQLLKNVVSFLGCLVLRPVFLNQRILLTCVDSGMLQYLLLLLIDSLFLIDVKALSLENHSVFKAKVPALSVGTIFEVAFDVI
jgi:hypothetical protein